MMYSTPDIGIICATYTRPKTILRLLDQLNNQKCVDFRSMSVCVVDDGSPYGSDFLKFPQYRFGFKYIYRERSADGTARVYSSRNIAAQNVHGGLLLQLDDDVQFHDYLINMLCSMAGMATDEHWAWCARISNNIDVDKSGFSAEQNWARGADGRWYDGRVFWQHAHWGDADSSAMLMPRRTWDTLGGYDEQFDGSMAAADGELALRVQKLGAKPGDVHIWVAPYFVNKADEETGSWRMDMINRRKRSEKNEDLMMRKHPDMKEWQNV